MKKFNFPKLYLASKSPRRQALLAQIHLPFEILSVEVIEQVLEAEDPASYVQRVALEKARAGWQSDKRVMDYPVLGADTEVVLENKIFGKPTSKQHGLEMLQQLSGRDHTVLCAIAVVQNEIEKVQLVKSTVYFREISPAEREAYWNTTEPLDKAGGYAVQGMGSLFVARIEGSYSAIMGLPVFETAEILKEFGVDIL